MWAHPLSCRIILLLGWFCRYGINMCTWLQLFCQKWFPCSPMLLFGRRSSHALCAKSPENFFPLFWYPHRMNFKICLCIISSDIAMSHSNKILENFDLKRGVSSTPRKETLNIFYLHNRLPLSTTSTYKKTFTEFTKRTIIQPFRILLLFRTSHWWQVSKEC